MKLYRRRWGFYSSQPADELDVWATSCHFFWDVGRGLADFPAQRDNDRKSHNKKQTARLWQSEETFKVLFFVLSTLSECMDSSRDSPYRTPVGFNFSWIKVVGTSQGQ